MSSKVHLTIILRKKIEVKSHHGVKRTFVYVKPDRALPTDQEPLHEWTNNTYYKLHKLHSTLDTTDLDKVEV